MSAFTGFLHEVPGKVEKIISSNEAEVSFKWNKTQKTAVLLKDNLYVDCQCVEAKFISDYLHVGSKVKLITSNPGSTSSTSQIRIIKAWRMEACDLGYPQFGFPNTLRPGLINAYVVVAEVSKKLAVLSYKNEDGKEESILMLASKLYIGKRRVNSSLTQIIQENDNFSCDAVPVIPSTNEKGCSWFATCVWRGNKPAYEKKKKPKGPVSLGEETDELAHNPNNLFLFGEGLIMKILNHENGILLGEIKPKVFQTILFHRSVCCMGDTRFVNADLNSVFLERDRIRFIAVKAPSRMVVPWVATYVAPHDYTDNADFQEHGMKV